MPTVPGQPGRPPGYPQPGYPQPGYPQPGTYPGTAYPGTAHPSTAYPSTAYPSAAQPQQSGYPHQPGYPPGYGPGYPPAPAGYPAYRPLEPAQVAPRNVSAIALLVIAALATFMTGIIGPPSVVMALLALKHNSTDPARAAKLASRGWIVFAINAIIGLALIVAFFWVRANR